jgi:hypothetical protein
MGTLRPPAFLTTRYWLWRSQELSRPSGCTAYNVLSKNW